MPVINACTHIRELPPEERFVEAAKCTVPGALVGGGLGAINDQETAVIGGLAGAAINSLICAVLANENDADGDGVSDDLDRCPETPKGMKVDKDGCPLDSDGDGVPDSADECPDTPKGFKVDAKGCPVDADGDGVLNGLDKCPDTPPGTKVDKTGCPEVGEPLLVIENVEFMFDRTDILDAYRFKLATAVEILNNHPKFKVKLVGHTDSIGTDEYNNDLSLRRAKSVREYLVTHGIDEGRMDVAGKGESEPVAPNTTDAERMKNRRVVFMLTEK